MDKAEMRADVERRIADHEVMLFMKGTADAPMCGFSAAAVDVLRRCGRPFGDKNVLEHPEYRYALSERSGWPTIPQVFVDGELVGGCDIVVELYQKGELQQKIDAAFAG